MELTTIGFSDMVKLGKVLWLRGAKSVKNHMIDSKLVKVMPISKNTGNTREFSEMDTNEYLTYKSQGDQASRGQISQGYSKTMTSYRVAENIGITYEMRTQGKYPEIINSLVSGGSKGYKTIDLDLSHRLTFGTDTTYTDRDGRTIDISVGDTLQLFYTEHTLKASSETFRNRLANNPRLSKGALEGIGRLAVEESYNQYGEKKEINDDILWTTDDPNTVNTAKEYLKSTADIEGSNSGVVNVYKGRFIHKILPRLATTAAGATDTDKRYYWGTACSERSSFYIGMWESPHLMAPKANANSEDVQTDDWEFRNRAGYGIVVVGASWIRFSSGDGTA